MIAFIFKDKLIILDLQRSCKDQRVLMPHLVLVTSVIYTTEVRVSKLSNQCWYVTVNSRLYSDFTSFSMNMFFSVAGFLY